MNIDQEIVDNNIECLRDGSMRISELKAALVKERREDLGSIIRFQRAKWRPKLIQWFDHCIDRGASPIEFMRKHNGWVRTMSCRHMNISKSEYMEILSSRPR